MLTCASRITQFETVRGRGESQYETGDVHRSRTVRPQFGVSDTIWGAQGGGLTPGGGHFAFAPAHIYCLLSHKSRKKRRKKLV